MKLGIIGLPQTGKKILFELLTGSKINITESAKSVSGVAAVRDERFDELVKMFKPKKEAPARIQLELLPKIEANTIKEGSIFRDIADMDALCHVVRAFNDDSIYHVNGSVNSARDIDSINSELTMYDLIFIEKRLERIENNRKKKNDKSGDEEAALLVKLKAHLEADLHLRTFTISEEEEKLIGSYPFITFKKMLIVLNVDDSSAGDSSLVKNLTEKYSNLGLDFMIVSAKLESEIAVLDSPEERKEFMSDAGIKEPALNILTALAMKTLGLISFFTVGEDEVRQWQIRSGSSAPVAAGAIHKDIQRGFIRAEVIKYNDLISLGSEDAVKKAGKLLVMGKDYIVEDGDIVHFRFNV